jgi:branched-chain amino acid transport system substrate-binding protein
MMQAKGKVADNATYYGCDGFDGIESADGFDITTIPQKISMLSHFNSKAESGAAADFIKKYTEKYGADTLNQFGAAAYDCVYALYNAMKEAKAEGKDINPNMGAETLCTILKDKFNGGFKFSGATGTDIKWQSTGFVDKTAIAYVIKDVNA